MPNKGLIEEKRRKILSYAYQPAFTPSTPCQSFFPPLNFSPIQATPLSPLFLPFRQSFSAFYYSPGPPLLLKDPEGGLDQLPHMSVRYSSQHTLKKTHPPPIKPHTLSPSLVPAEAFHKQTSLHTQIQMGGYGKFREGKNNLHCGCVYGCMCVLCPWCCWSGWRTFSWKLGISWGTAGVCMDTDAVPRFLRGNMPRQLPAASLPKCLHVLPVAQWSSTDHLQTTSALTPSFLRGAASHSHAQCATFVQMPKLYKLLRHGVEPFIGQDIVVVMVTDRLLVQADGKRPEAVGSHLLAQPQGQADQEEPCGEAFGVHVVGFPEFSHRAQEFGVGKEHGEVGGGVCQGVVRPQWWVSARLHGERRHVDVAGAVDLHTVHKIFSRPQKALKS